MSPTIRGIAMVLATGLLFLLAGCASTGGQRGYPGGYGQSGPAYPTQYGSPLQGTVEDLDTAYQRIVLVADDPRSGRSQRLDVRYDARTRLFYEGRESAVEGLERGDVVRIDVAGSGRELWARSIDVVRNVRDGGYGGYGDYGDPDGLRGIIGLVDTRARLIRLDDGGYGTGTQLDYDGRTTVEYQGRSYRPEDLERGDEVRIWARRLGNGQWLAERIIVERSMGR